MNSSIAIFIYIYLGLVTAWLIVGTLIFMKISQQLKQITQGISKKDLKTILTQITGNIKESNKQIKELRSEIDDVEQRMKHHFQKMGYIRFNPFSDTGGDQSFSLCLLNDHNNGIVITSLHSRDSTRIYTKEIKNGSAFERELSKEEQQALKDALKKK